VPQSTKVQTHSASCPNKEIHININPKISIAQTASWEVHHDGSCCRYCEDVQCNVVPQWEGSTAGSERGKFSTSGFHLTVPVSLLPTPPVRTL